MRGRTQIQSFTTMVTIRITAIIFLGKHRRISANEEMVQESQGCYYLPSQTIATTGPDAMYFTNPGKNLR